MYRYTVHLNFGYPAFSVARYPACHVRPDTGHKKDWIIRWSPSPVGLKSRGQKIAGSGSSGHCKCSLATIVLFQVKVIYHLKAVIPMQLFKLAKILSLNNSE